MGKRGKGEVLGQPTARVAYINKGGPTSSRAIGREKGKKGKACARYGYRYPYTTGCLGMRTRGIESYKIPPFGTAPS